MTLRRYALPLILLLALVLRLVNLGERNLWYDEAFAILFAGKGLDAMLYGTLTPVAGGAADIHPLLYYATLGGWMSLFGDSAFAARLLSVVFGVASVGLMYLLGRDLFNAQTGLAAALITAIAPFHVQYSQEARMYSLLGLLLVVATWCFVRGSRQPDPVLLGGRWSVWFSRWGWWIAFGLLAALAMYTQQLAAFYVAALGLVPLLRRDRQQLAGVVLGAGVAMLVYLPWLVQLPGQLSKVGSYYWITAPQPARLLLTLRAFFTAGIDLPANLAAAAFVGAFFIFLFLLIQVFMMLRRPRWAERGPLLLALWLFAAPVALMWLVSQARPVYLERALLPSALMLYMALAWLFARGGVPRPVARVVGTLGLALVAIGLYSQYTWERFPNSPFRQAASAIHAGWQAGDAVIHQSKLSALPMIVYDRGLTQRFIADVPGSPEDTLALPTQAVLGVELSPCAAGAGQGAERIWFVTFADALRQSEAAGRSDVREAFDWLGAHYTLVEHRTFNDLDVSLYANPGAAARSVGCGAG